MVESSASIRKSQDSANDNNSEIDQTELRYFTEVDIDEQQVATLLMKKKTTKKIFLLLQTQPLKKKRCFQQTIMEESFNALFSVIGVNLW